MDTATRSRIATARGRLGGLTNASRHGGQAAVAPARAGFLRRFELQVDPDGSLHPDERAKRAHHALKAHMARLALRSAASRRKAS